MCISYHLPTFAPYSYSNIIKVLPVSIYYVISAMYTIAFVENIGVIFKIFFVLRAFFFFFWHFISHRRFNSFFIALPTHAVSCICVVKLLFFVRLSNFYFKKKKTAPVIIFYRVVRFRHVLVFDVTVVSRLRSATVFVYYRLVGGIFNLT